MAAALAGRISNREGAAADVTVQRSDLLLIRTGHMARYLDRGDWRNFDLDPFPGVSVPARRSTPTR